MWKILLNRAAMSSGSNKCNPQAKNKNGKNQRETVYQTERKVHRRNAVIELLRTTVFSYGLFCIY